MKSAPGRLISSAARSARRLPPRLTNATGLPVSTGISGLGTGVATFLGTPSSANLSAALTTKTGTGNAVFGTGPTVTGLIHGDITGSTQCLHVNTSGLVTGTGSDCGSGGALADDHRRHQHGHEHDDADFRPGELCRQRLVGLGDGQADHRDQRAERRELHALDHGRSQERPR